MLIDALRKQEETYKPEGPSLSIQLQKAQFTLFCMAILIFDFEFHTEILLPVTRDTSMPTNCVTPFYATHTCVLSHINIHWRQEFGLCCLALASNWTECTRAILGALLVNFHVNGRREALSLYVKKEKKIRVESRATTFLFKGWQIYAPRWQEKVSCEICTNLAVCFGPLVVSALLE